MKQELTKLRNKLRKKWLSGLTANNCSLEMFELRVDAFVQEFKEEKLKLISQRVVGNDIILAI